jgi:hypothetical protein
MIADDSCFVVQIALWPTAFSLRLTALADKSTERNLQVTQFAKLATIAMVGRYCHQAARLSSLTVFNMILMPFSSNHIIVSLRQGMINN